MAKIHKPGASPGLRATGSLAKGYGILRMGSVRCFAQTSWSRDPATAVTGSEKFKEAFQRLSYVSKKTGFSFGASLLRHLDGCAKRPRGWGSPGWRFQRTTNASSGHGHSAAQFGYAARSFRDATGQPSDTTRGYGDA